MNETTEVFSIDDDVQDDVSEKSSINDILEDLGVKADSGIVTKKPRVSPTASTTDPKAQSKKASKDKAKVPEEAPKDRKSSKKDEKSSTDKKEEISKKKKDKSSAKVIEVPGWTGKLNLVH